MKTYPISHIPKASFNALLKGIPFFKDLLENDPDQLANLMAYAKIVESDPGDVVMKKGDSDPWLYFVLKGQLMVYPDKRALSMNAVNYISSGEVVGALALIQSQPRSATVSTDPKSRKATLLGIHYAAFGHLTNFDLLNLKTKLNLLKMVNHNTRWKIEQYRAQYPSNPLGKRLNSLSVYKGKKDTVDHLHALHQETGELGKMLREWNIALQFTRNHHVSARSM